MPTGQIFAVGDKVAGTVVAESEPSRLVFSTPWYVLVIELGGGLLLLAGGWAGAATQHGLMQLGAIWMLIFAGFLLSFGCLNLKRQPVAIDGHARTVARGWGPLTKTWSVDDIAAIRLDVGHTDRLEHLDLAIQTTRGTTFVLLRGASQFYGDLLARAGQQIAEMLRLPIERAGEAAQGGLELWQQLRTLQPDAAEGDGRNLIIHCPKCKEQNVPGVAWILEEQRGLLTHRTTWVKCLACGTSLYSRRSAEELVGLSPELLSEIIFYRISLINRFLAIIAIALSVIPMLGFVLSLVSLAVNWRQSGWTKRVSWIATCISSVVTILVVVALILGR